MTQARRVSVLLDENVDKQVLSYLRAEGYDGEHLVDAMETGVDDAPDIIRYACRHDHVIVTKDTDFLTMDEADHEGVFFIENHRWSAYDIATTILRVLDTVSDRSYLRGVVFLSDWA
jgi:hypothetical protein